MLLRIEHSLRCTVQAYVRTIERVRRVVKQLATCSLMASAGATGKSQTKKASSRTKKTTFKVKERRELLLVLEGNDYADLVNTAIVSGLSCWLARRLANNRGDRLGVIASGTSL